MSKLYKDLKYDTDWVMQPGDPLTSFDGNTSVQAVNGGKATITMPGLAEPGASLSNDVTLEDLIQLLDLPETSTLDDVRSVLGLPATATLYDASVTPVTKALVTSPVKWEEISNKPTSFAPAAHEHSAANITSGTLSVARGGTGVDGSVQGSNKVLASPSTGAAGAVSFRALTAADIPNLNTSKITSGTLGVARGGTGKASHTVNSILAGNASSTTGTIQNIATASGALYATSANGQASFGTLPIAQGGTGATSASAARTNLEITAANIPFENNQTVGAAIRDLYDTTAWVDNDVLKVGATEIATLKLANNKTVATTDQLPSGTSPLPIAQGGTGVNGSSQAINKVLASPASGSAGAISFRSLTVADLPTGTTSSTVALGNHTHSDYVSKSTTSNQNISGAITLVNTGNITVSPTSGGVSAGIGVASGNDAYVHASQDGVGGTEINPTGFAHYHPDGTVTDLTFPVPAKSGVIVTSTSLAENLNILPITTSTALSITMTADKYMYKVTDSGATGTFPTLTAPTGLQADCYYKFELEWVTASPTATYAQTASTTPAMKWISSPVMQTDGLSHTYHISGRYDTTTSTFWMSCWKIDDAQGAITPDSHTMKYLLTTPEQVASTTTNTNDTITVQLSDHAINTVQVPTTATNVVMKFPGQAVGKARDFMVRLIVTGETVPSITLTEPDGSAVEFDVDDDSWTEIEKGVNLLMFTETAQ